MKSQCRRLDGKFALVTGASSGIGRAVAGQTIYACGGLSLYGEFRTNWVS